MDLPITIEFGRLRGDMIETYPKYTPALVTLRIVSGFYSGGAELLFGKIKRHSIILPERKLWTIRDLLVWMKDNMLKERPELFLQGDTVRPGILVLINDADWELLGELDYEISKEDRIVFISTLHGG